MEGQEGKLDQVGTIQEEHHMASQGTQVLEDHHDPILAVVDKKVVDVAGIEELLEEGVVVEVHLEDQLEVFAGFEVEDLVKAGLALDATRSVQMDH